MTSPNCAPRPERPTGTLEAPGALAAVLLDNREALLRFLVARGAGDLAEDLLQDLWVKLSAAAPGPITDPLAYLYRAADNLMLDRRRSELRRSARELAWNEAGEEYDGGVALAPSSIRTLIARQELAIAEGEVARLGDRTLRIFRRHRLDGAKQAQIASELGISVSSVEKHLRKAYDALIALRARVHG